MCHLDNSTHLALGEPRAEVICLWSTSFAQYFMHSFTIKTNQRPEQLLLKEQNNNKKFNAFFLKKSDFILPCHALKKCPTYSCITGLTLTWTASHFFDEKYLPGRKAEAFCHLPNNWSSRGLKHLPHQPEDWWTVNSRYQIAWSYAGSARQQPEILSSKFVWGNP